METLKFKTNINCGGCIEKVRPHLNNLKSIIKWDVDTVNPLKILTIETTDNNPNVIIEELKTAGYKADLIADK